MALLKLDLVDLINVFAQCHHIIYEKSTKIYSFVDNTSVTIATFNNLYKLATIYNQPGIMFLFNNQDLEHYIKKIKPIIYHIDELSNNTNSLSPNYRMDDLKQTHPNNYQFPTIEGLSAWTLLDCGDAVRYYVHCDTNLYGSRAAYISKSARVRVRDNQWETVGGRSSEYGLDIDNMKACDEELIKLGFLPK